MKEISYSLVRRRNPKTSCACVLIWPKKLGLLILLLSALSNKKSF
jgi:hypothetical protein